MELKDKYKTENGKINYYRISVEVARAIDDTMIRVIKEDKAGTIMGYEVLIDLKDKGFLIVPKEFVIDNG